MIDIPYDAYSGQSYFEFKNGKTYEGCDSARSLGNKQGKEDRDRGAKFRYRPGIPLRHTDFKEYRNGYAESYNNLDKNDEL